MTESKDQPKQITLAELPLESCGYIVGININGLLRRRLLDLGFIPGTKVTPKLASMWNNPRKYSIKDTDIALRHEDAREVMVSFEPVELVSSATDNYRTCGAAFSSCRQVDANDIYYIVALAGNPNTGKSTIFNALTGLRQHVGNWPGKTVMRAEGWWKYASHRFKIVDLPGTYSLLSMSDEEEIARNFLLHEAPECTVVVVDATCLERNLNLVLQVFEISNRVVVCANLIDEAEHIGVEINAQKLEEFLGVPVVLTAARSKRGFDKLLQSITAVAAGQITPKPIRFRLDKELQDAVNDLVPLIEDLYPKFPNPEWIAIRLIDGADKRLRRAIEQGDFVWKDK